MPTKETKSVNDYELIIANLDRSCIDELLKLQEERNPNVKWVSLIERCATDYLQADERLKRLLDNSDLVNVINGHTLDFFRALTTAKCEYIGIPFPAEGIRRMFYVPPSERGDYIMLPPYIDPPGVTHISSYLAAKDFGREMRAAQLSEFNYGNSLYKPTGKYLEPKEYLSMVANSFCFVNLDHRYTQARTVLECAALGVPCISTFSTFHGGNLFPTLTVNDEFDLSDAKDCFRYVGDFQGYADRHIDSEFYFSTMTHEYIAKRIMEGVGL